MSNEIHAITSENRMCWRLQPGNVRRTRHGPALRVDVSTCEYRDDARRRLRGRSVDANHTRMRVRAAKQGGVKQARQTQIVHVGGNAFDEARILDTLERPADVLLRAHLCPSACPECWPAAYCTASMMWLYPVHRHKFPLRP